MIDFPKNKQLLELEWLQTNQAGSFALGCIDRIPRRKYHSLITVREPGMGDALNILSEVGETITLKSKKFLLHSLNYNGEIFPQGFQHLLNFSHHPLPTWTYDLDGVKLERQLALDKNHDIVRIHYRITGVKDELRLNIEPMLVYRPFHRLTQENPFLNGSTSNQNGVVSLQPYPALPRLYMKVSGQSATFTPAGRWDRKIFYSIERERGYDPIEDLYCPGSFDLTIKEDCTLTFGCGIVDSVDEPAEPKPITELTRSFKNSLNQAASQFLYKTKDGFHTMVAGYPWFGGWSRDTLISLPGICFATGHINMGVHILENFGSLLLKGIMPNTPNSPEQNQNTKLDTILLYIRCVQLLEKYSGKNGIKPFMPVVYHLLMMLKDSTKPGHDDRISVTSDGGIFVKPGPHPMTWMDAMIDNQPVTPRFGYAVELNALFYNAIQFALEWAQASNHADFVREWRPLANQAETTFMQRFWSKEYGYLADCHSGAAPDFSLRPNQLWAIALPYSPVPLAAAREALEHIRTALLTPVGLRTLSPLDPHYRGKYCGPQRERDLAYHQGTVWPWLLGVYADALLRVHGPARLRQELIPVLERIESHMYGEGCIGQISEVFDGDMPHTAGGTPAQAWSVAEVLRINEMQNGNR